MYYEPSDVMDDEGDYEDDDDDDDDDGNPMKKKRTIDVPWAKSKGQQRYRLNVEAINQKQDQSVEGSKRDVKIFSRAATHQQYFSEKSVTH